MCIEVMGKKTIVFFDLLDIPLLLAEGGNDEEV
jgi:hypothetical protein